MAKFKLFDKSKRFRSEAEKRVSRNPDYKIITAIKPMSIAAESYRRIKVGLDYASIDNKIQVLQMCSAMQGEGKTTTLLNIAQTYAEDNKKVIVLDLDLRRSKLHRAFKVENVNGLVDYLAGKVTLEEAIKHSPNNIDFLNRGSKVEFPTTILASEKLQALIGELRNMYDMILIDCPPILSVSDCCIISRFCDGAIYVISQKATEKAAAKEAVAVLRQNNVNLLGVVLCEVKEDTRDYYYSSKYKYYHQNYGGDKK